jgi:hypothetical protein
LNRITEGWCAIRQITQSLNRSRRQQRLHWHRDSVGRVAAAAVPSKSTAASDRHASRVRQTAQLPRRAAFAIGPVALSAGLQVSTPSCPQAQRHVRIPAPQTALLSNAVVVSGPCNWPPPLFPPCLWLCVPGVTFFICSSEPLHLAHAARPDDAAFSSLASSHNHNRSVLMRGHRGSRIGKRPQARWHLGSEMGKHRVDASTSHVRAG